METNSFDEVVLLTYFDYLSKNYAPNSLWFTYSKLKTTINCYDQVDIGSYKKILSFLKKKSSGYQPKKSAIFTKENIVKFLSYAPDEIYLSTKVSTVYSLYKSSMRCEE